MSAIFVDSGVISPRCHSCCRFVTLNKVRRVRYTKFYVTFNIAQAAVVLHAPTHTAHFCIEPRTQIHHSCKQRLESLNVARFRGGMAQDRPAGCLV